MTACALKARSISQNVAWSRGCRQINATDLGAEHGIGRDNLNRHRTSSGWSRHASRRSGEQSARMASVTPLHPSACAKLVRQPRRHRVDRPLRTIRMPRAGFILILDVGSVTGDMLLDGDPLAAAESNGLSGKGSEKTIVELVCLATIMGDNPVVHSCHGFAPLRSLGGRRSRPHRPPLPRAPCATVCTWQMSRASAARTAGERGAESPNESVIAAGCWLKTLSSSHLLKARGVTSYEFLGVSVENFARSVCWARPRR